MSGQGEPRSDRAPIGSVDRTARRGGRRAAAGDQRV